MSIKSFNVIFFIFLTIIPFSIYGQNSNDSIEKNNGGIKVVLNKVHDGGKSGIKSRHIFILMNEQDFSLNNLTNLFKECKNLYTEPYILTVTVYSDKEMLEKLINFEKQPVTIEFADNEKGREASKKFYERSYPLPQGYFRAEYNRYGKFEFFDYSPEKEQPEMIRISLKDSINKNAPAQLKGDNL